MTEAQPAHGTTDITPLLQPLRVGRLTLKNRFVVPGMQRAWCEDGAPTVKLREYYRRRAEGGTALVICEACAVDQPQRRLIRRFERGDFDLISVGRSLSGDPDWVAEMRDGRGAEIRPFRRTDLEWLT